MVSCTASFQETSVNVGDVIHADFTWTDALWHIFDNVYAVMRITDPTGATRAVYFEYVNDTGSHSLSFTTDMAGTWTALISVANITQYVECTDTVMVSGGTTECTASFQETSVNVGDVIHADFTWTNAIFHISDNVFAVMRINDPTGTTRAVYFEYNNNTGSKQLSFTTDMAGIWTALIEVAVLTYYIECTDTVAVSVPQNWTLDEALTCDWVIGYNDHGPMVTDFNIGEDVYAYIEVHGPDMYGKTVRHEWWYKETGQTEFTKRWEWTSTCGSHYTEWATWTWWDIGSSYGSGEGYIGVYFDDVFLGKTNNYTIIAPVIGRIHEDSVFHTRPFQGGSSSIRVIDLYIQNIRGGTGQLNTYVYEYPNNQGGTENMIASFGTGSIPPNGVAYIPVNLDIPLMSGAWPLGVKVFGLYEPEPPWGAMGTKIFKIHNQLL